MVAAPQNSLPMMEAFLPAFHSRAQGFFKDESTQGSSLVHCLLKKRAPWRRHAFRAGGFILLFLSISLPFLIQLADEPHRQAQMASTLAWLIALVAAANSFFNSQKAW